MPLPSNWTTITLTGTLVDTLGVPVSGKVTFTPQPTRLSNPSSTPPASIVAVKHTVTLDVDGAFSIDLPVTDDPDVAPIDWTWQVKEHFSNGATYNVLLPSSLGSTVDLADLVTVDALTGNAGITLAEFRAIRDEVQALRDEAVLITGLPAADDAFALLIGDSGSASRAALDEVGDVRYAAMVPPPTENAVTDTANIQAKITAALAFGIDKVRLQEGTYRTNAPLAGSGGAMPDLVGAGRERTFIRNAVSDVFQWSASGTTIRDMSIYSEAGGGHVFLQTGLVRRCNFTNLYIDQANDAKSIYSHIADLGNYLFNTWSHVTARHTNTATVPGFHFVAITSAGAVNANTWEDMDPTRSGNYAFWFESARSANYVYDNVLRDIRFEQPDGGCVKLLGTDGVKFESHTIYDYLSPTRVPYYIGRGTHASSPVSNRNLTFRDLLFISTPGTFPHVQLQSTDGGVAPAEDTVFDSCGAHLGNITVDFGNNSKIATINSRITRVNGDRVVSYSNTGPRLAPATYVHAATGTTGLAVDAAGGAQTYGPHDVGLGAQQVLNSEFDTDIRQWTDTGTVLSYSAGTMRMNNTSGGFLNMTGACAAALTGGQVYKVVLKLASVTSFPAPTTSLRLYDGTTYQTITNTTSEQTFYQTLGSGGVVLRTGDGLDVTLDYIRVYPVTTSTLFAHGPLSHRGSTLGFYGVTPVTRPAAYTQTYATASRTHAAYTADAESAAYTGATDGEAKLADLNALRVAYENLRVAHESTAQVLNQVIDDLQAGGLLQ